MAGKHVRRMGVAKGSKAMAVLATALVLAVLVIPLVSAPGGTDAGPSTYERTITYYQSQADYEADTDGSEATVTENLLSQTYHGVATSEYNPQYWGFNRTFTHSVSANFTFDFEVRSPAWNWGDATFHGNERIKLDALTLSNADGIELDGQFSISGRGGIIYASEATVHLAVTYNGPGVFTGWITPTGEPVEPGDLIPDGVDALIATWSAPDCFMTGDKELDHRGHEDWYVVDSRSYSQRNTGDICIEHSNKPEYTTIINVPGNTTMSGTLPSGTYRGGGAGTVVTVDGKLTLDGDAVFDSMAIRNNPNGYEKHGDQNYGIFANGNKLIMGTGLTLPSGTGMTYALQVFGGSDNGTVGETRVLIHSGVYYNVVAGGWNGTVAGSTYLVMRGGTVLDTVVGGNGGQSANTVGSTHVYIVGGKLPADSYVEDEMEEAGNTPGAWEPPADIFRQESTIITGGSNNGTVQGNTHVYVSGIADVWDVQAGGRRGSSTVVGTATMEVSGKAIVRHVACGSITDGNSSNGDRSCVGGTDITVKDGAMVASVYGAGYDTYASVTYVSMMGGGSTISISIESGTVGYVYGGGYRGSVGTPDYPIDSVSIEITGGTVLGDVFGGGRGGVDKAMHNQNGSLFDDSQQSGMSDSTGLSKVYAGFVGIRITGGTVHGSVFGGGESVPVLTGTTSGPMGQGGVAEMVVDTVNIYVGDCVIDGSVYGAGKGLVGPDGSEKPNIVAMLVKDGAGSILNVEWYEGSDSLTYKTSAEQDYSSFAKVAADGISITFQNYRTDELPEATGREGSIYGGGMFGTADVARTVSITIDDSTVSDSVFGGGEGTPESTSPGSLTADTVSIWVSGSKTIIGKPSLPYSVIGGGRNAMVTADEVSVVLEDGATMIGDVHGGGLGSESAQGDSFSTTEIMSATRSVVLNGASVQGSIYGGSRLGQDGDGTSYEVSSVAIIDGTVTQSVYGGGFQGVSYLDSKIYIGTPAREVALAFLGNRLSTAPTGSIHIGSVYGGGNLSGADTGSSQSGSPLLMGDVSIEVGFSPVGGYAADQNGIRIEGDVFGEGNYSTLASDKTAYVHIHDWRPATSTVKSVQRCDELLIENARVELLGSTDGAAQGLTELFSLAGIGRLQLDRSVLELNSETTRISEYVSTIDGDPSERGDCLRSENTEYRGNEIILHQGRPFTLVDYSSGGTLTVGTVSGYTLVSKAGDDSYYGAFAIGAAAEGSEAMTGFMVNDGNDEASVVNRDIGGTTVSTWYLAGHFTLGEQVTYEQLGADAAVAENITLDFHMPRLYRQDAQTSNTVYTYISSYVTPTIQDGMYVVDEGSEADRMDGYDDYKPASAEHRTYLSMVLRSGDPVSGESGSSVSAATHELNANGDGWDRKVSEGHVPLGNPSTIYLDTALLIPKTLEDGTRSTQSVGMLGVVTIQLSESLPVTNDGVTTYVPVNMIDIEISVYVKPHIPKNNVTDIVVTVMTRGGAGGQTGRGHINLPSGNGDPITFRIQSVEGLGEGEKATMWSDTTHLGLSGWTVIRYPEGGGCDLGSFVPESDLYFGEGGIRDTSIAFEYTGNTTGFTMTLVGTTNAESSVKYTYNVTVRVQEQKDVLVGFSYESIADGSASETEVFSLYVKDKGDGLSPGTGFELQWAESQPEGYSVMKVPYGTLFSDDVLFFLKDASASTSLQELVEGSLESRTVTVNGQTGNYRDYLTDWFVDPGCISRFNTASPMSESMTLYAGLGVTVTFDGRGAGVNPQKVTLKPGESLSMYYNNVDETNENKVSIWNGVEPPGKHLYHIDGAGHHSWMLANNTPWNFGDGVFQDLNLYLRWEDEEYTINVVVTDKDDETISTTLTVTGGEDWNGTSFTSKYAVPVSVGLEGTGSIITGATLTWEGGSAPVTGVGTRTIGFVTPDPGDQSSGTPRVMTLAMTVSVGYTLTVDVESTDTGIMTSGDRLQMFVGDVTEESKPYAVFSQSVTQATVPVEAGKTYKLTFKYVPGSSNQGRENDVYWVYYEKDGEGGESMHTPPWMQYIRGKTQDPYTSDLVDSDVTLRLEIYVAVDITYVGQGVESLHAYERTGTSAVFQGDKVFSGEPLYVYADAGYNLPPSVTEGLSPGGILEDEAGTQYALFTVIGNRDVVIGDLSRIMVTLTVDIEAQRQTGGGYTPIEDAGSRTVTVTVNESTVRVFADHPIGTPVTVEVPLNTGGTGYGVTVSAEGFRDGTAQISSGTEGTATLTLIEYTVVYLDPDGDELTGGGGAESWDVLQGYVRPGYTLSDGTPATATGTFAGYTGQIWLEAVYGGGGYATTGEAVTMLSTDLFSSDGTLHLIAVPMQGGGFAETETSFIMLTESDFGTALEANLFDRDVTFVLNGCQVRYTAGEPGSLELPAELAGTGNLYMEATLEDGTVCRLLITVVADGAGGNEPRIPEPITSETP